MMIRGGMTVAVRGWRGIAFNVVRRRGTEVTVVMVGGLGVHRNVPVADVSPLGRKAFCASCGQVGCRH